MKLSRKSVAILLVVAAVLCHLIYYFELTRISFVSILGVYVSITGFFDAIAALYIVRAHFTRHTKQIAIHSAIILSLLLLGQFILGRDVLYEIGTIYGVILYATIGVVCGSIFYFKRDALQHIDEDEKYIKAIADKITDRMSKPVVVAAEQPLPNTLDGDVDDIFMDVAQYAIKHQAISASAIQREFSIGYNRAGRIMDQLQKENIISPYVEGEPYKVLIEDVKALEKRYNL